MQPTRVVGQLLHGERRNLFVGEPLEELAQVTAIGHDRVVGQVTLGAQVVGKGREPRMLAGRCHRFAGGFDHRGSC